MRPLSALLLFTLLAPTALTANNDRFARIVLFIPAETDAPEHYEQRLGSLAIRTELFLAKWMKHWNRPIERSQIFARNDDGSIAVTLVKGTLTNANGRAALPEIRSTALEEASRSLPFKVSDHSVWWIFYNYPGVKGFQGGLRKSGGVAINAYPKGAGLIDPKLDLAAPAMVEQSIKGTIHEFGHALGLPHIGARPALNLGNTLMGPVNRAYWKKFDGQDPRVHLSEASAATLWKHPVFKTKASPDPNMPKNFKVTGLTVTESENKQQVIVQGTLKTSVPAHTVIVLDSERGQFGDYWARSYTSPIDPKTGQFKITLDAPYANGVLFLSFSLTNGTTTSDGTQPFQRGCSLTVPYSTKDGSRHFGDGE